MFQKMLCQRLHGFENRNVRAARHGVDAGRQDNSLTLRFPELTGTGSMRGMRITGFTLIELMIVVAVVAILAAIAVPSYQQYVRESRRADAQSIMLDLQLREEKYRASNNDYADDATLGVPTHAYYTFTIVAAANTYTITATAKSSQTSDTGCTPLTLDQNGTKGPAGCWKS